MAKIKMPKYLLCWNSHYAAWRVFNRTTGGSKWFPAANKSDAVACLDQLNAN